jgi:gliding motility-associated-like protein
LLFICPPEELQVTPGVFAFYEWSDGSNDSFFDIFDAGTYSVTITSAAGCTASDSVVVLENCFTDVFLPSAFTPNVDGKNEVFMPVSGLIPFMRFSVYNRMGQQLYVTETQGNGWDGTYSGGECPEGIYAWKVEYRGPDNKNREKYGWFMLIR